MNEELQWKAARNPALAARITGAPIMPYPGEEMWESVPGYFQSQAQAALFAALTLLEDNLRDVIIAIYGEGLSLADYGRRISRSRERARQLEAKALRRLRFWLRNHFVALHASIKVVPIPDGPRDPRWLGTKQAAELTDLTRDHIRYLAQGGKIKSRNHPTKGMRIQIERASLKAYVLHPGCQGRIRKGIWKGD